jgi:hypothetical protein
MGMALENNSNKKEQQGNETVSSKYRIGNYSFYQYKDPNGKTVQISRPAFVKINTIE